MKIKEKLLYIFLILLSLITIPFIPKDLTLVRGQELALEFPNWQIKFNSTGTHIQKNKLKIRLDFYPSYFSKTFDLQYVYVIDQTSPEFITGYSGEFNKEGQPIDIDDFNLWRENLPHIWQLNPSISIFLSVDKDTTEEELKNYIQDTYNPDVITTIDNILASPDSIHYINSFMADKTTLSSITSMNYTVNNIIDSNNKFSELIISNNNTGIILPTNSNSIYLGSDAIDRAGVGDIGGNVIITADNQANGTGTVTNGEIWLDTASSGVTVGTNIDEGSNTFSTRDYESIGAISAGSKQTFSGLDIDVTTNDYAGVAGVAGAGYIERDHTSGNGYWFFSPNKSMPLSSETGTWYTPREISLNLVGTEATGEEIQFIPRIIFIN